MTIKGNLTNKQTAALGVDKEDNGQNLYEEDRKKRQRKNDNIKPR